VQVISILKNKLGGAIKELKDLKKLSTKRFVINAV
jgi:hypothetical protein